MYSSILQLRVFKTYFAYDNIQLSGVTESVTGSDLCNCNRSFAINDQSLIQKTNLFQHRIRNSGRYTLFLNTINKLVSAIRRSCTDHVINYAAAEPACQTCLNTALPAVIACPQVRGSHNPRLARVMQCSARVRAHVPITNIK